MNDYTVPWERRRKVPWTGLDVLALFVLYLVLMQNVGGFMKLFHEPKSPGTSATTVEHPLSQLVNQGRGSMFVWFVVFFSGVVSAPLGEEFLFRLVLQGWLEKTETLRFKRRFFFFPHGFLSVVFSSLLFAAPHGGGRQEQAVDTLFFSILGMGIVNIGFTLFGVAFLRWKRRATWTDLGLRFHRLPTDVGLAFAFFVLFVPSIFFIHVVVQNLFPGEVTDPIPLFFFALVLGILFYRTRRLTGCILLHAMLNGASFLALAVGI